MGILVYTLLIMVYTLLIMVYTSLIMVHTLFWVMQGLYHQPYEPAPRREAADTKCRLRLRRGGVGKQGIP